MEFTIILDNPKYEGNIGYIARAMKNFGFKDLVIIGTNNLGKVARSRASNAQDILEDANFTKEISDVIDDFDIRVATTGIRGESEDKFKRNPVLTPNELKSKLSEKEGCCGLFFGREDHGLKNNLIEKCEIVLSIPSSKEYPVLNLSHAVAIVLYEISNISKGKRDLANRDELDSVENRIKELFTKINYPEYKLDKTKLMLKRIFGRATLTSREAHTLSGLLRRIKEQLKENQ